MEDFKNDLCASFLKCFAKVKFLVTSKKVAKKTPEVVKDSISHLNKMLATAKKNLNKAIKSHKAGKLAIEDVMDHEYHVFDLQEEIKRIIEIETDQDDELI